MLVMPAENFELLEQARARAMKLLDDLETRRRELESNPPRLSEGELALGKEAMQNTIAAARRTLAALDKALKKHSRSENNS
jgi:hypothetical protein